jgi:hypothetical protein
MLRVRLVPLVLAALLVALVLPGCGSKPVPVTGEILWEDGKPVTSANVVFVPRDESGKRATGYTKEDGSFELTTSRPGDGAVPGDYTVLVTKGAMAIEEPQGDDKADPRKMMLKFKEKQKQLAQAAGPVIPLVYAKQEASPLRAKVEAGAKIQLKLKKKA